MHFYAGGAIFGSVGCEILYPAISLLLHFYFLFVIIIVYSMYLYIAYAIKDDDDCETNPVSTSSNYREVGVDRCQV